MTDLNSPITINQVIQKVNENSLPDATGHTGEFLKAGSDGLEWDSVEALPDQTGHSGEVLSTNGTTASWKASDSLKNLTSTLEEEVTTFGTYNGNEVANNTVFTSDDGSFKEFTKVQETGETSFKDSGITFPNSSCAFFVTKITKTVDGVDTDFYMAVPVAGSTKCYTSLNRVTWSEKGDPGIGSTILIYPFYINGVWVVRNKYSEDDGATWNTSTGGVDPQTDISQAGAYIFATYESGNKYWITSDGKSWTECSFTHPRSVCYDGEKYILAADGNLYTSTTPADVSSWQQVTFTQAPSRPKIIRYNNGRYYSLSTQAAWDYSMDFSVATDITNWTVASTISGNNNQPYGIVMFVGDVIFIQNTATGNILMSSDYGDNFDVSITGYTTSGVNYITTVVGNELWEIHGGKIYALNPNARWVYSLTNIGSLTDIAEAGNGIKFAPPQNFDVVGTPTLSEHVLSNTTDTDYLQINSPSSTFAPSTSSWEIITRVKTPADVSSQKSIFDNPTDQRGFRLGISVNGKWQLLISNGSYWLNGGSHEGSHTVQADTVYWLKAGFTGAAYYLEYSTDGTNFTPDLSSPFSDAIEQNSGIYLMTYSNTWDGEIYLDETSISIGGNVWTTPYSSSTKTKIAADILMPSSTPDSSLNGFAGQIAIYGGNAYICVDGSNTWKQFTS